MKKQPKPIKQQRREAIEAFCMQQYGHIPKWKMINIKHCTKYYLTEYGHRFKFVGYPLRISIIKGDRQKGRTSKSGKKWKSGFPVDHFYRTKEGEKSKVFFSIPRSKLMYMVWKNWTITKVRHFNFFPKDGNNDNCHIDNLQPFEKFMEGAEKTYGKPSSGKLDNRDIINIRDSKKTNQELGEKYNRNKHTISRIRNNHAYKEVIKLV